MLHDANPLDRLPLGSLTWREHEILGLLAEHKTNREIAATLNLEPTTVKWYNTQIYSKLDVSNRRQAAAQAEALGLLDKPSKPVTQPPNNLPAPVTSFIGRAAEQAQLTELLGEPSIRLLTLAGPPGTGKTRLALEVASKQLDRFDDGVFFVALAPLQNPDLVASAIADVLGVKQAAGRAPLNVLKAHLSRKRMLLVLDNFEHVVGVAPQLAELLAGAPDLKILVTSRERLRLYGEHEFYVPPLALPEFERDRSLSWLAQVEAISLFVERARAIRPDFALAESNASVVTDICVQVDGLPLAIELAAARVKILPLGELRERLSSRLDTLRGSLQGLSPRHQTLRATIDWSYHLLDVGEQMLFNRLGVFRGGCTLEAAEAVCGPDLPMPVLDGLEGLLDRSLLYRERGQNGQSRFVYLETLREYALERLEENGEAGATRRRHAEHYVTLAEKAEPKIRTAEQNSWLARLDAEHDNLRAALKWSLEGGDATLGLRLAGALFRYCYQHSHAAEGRRWLEHALEHAPPDVPSEARAKACTHVVLLISYMGLTDHPQMSGWADEGLALYRKLGDKLGHCLALLAKSGSLVFAGDVEAAERLGQEALALAREIKDADTIAFTLIYLGEIARFQEDFKRALGLHTESLVICKELDNRFLTAVELANLGFTCQSLGDMEQMEAYFIESLTVAWEQGMRDFFGYLAAGLACVAVENGRPGRAARLLGAAEILEEVAGMQMQPQDRANIEPCVGAAKAQLDAETFEALWEEGRAMTEEQAVAYALGKSME